MYPVIYEIYCFALLTCCVLTGCLLVRKSWTRGFKLLVILSCMTLGVEIAALFFQHKPNRLFMLLYNVWIFLEPATMIYILSCEATHPAAKRLCRILLALLLPAAVICHALSPRFANWINEYANLTYLFACLIAACSVLVGILLDISDRLLFTRPVFWLAAGILFYSSTFILIHAIGLFSPYLLIKYYIYFSVVANTFQYGGFIGCYLALRRKDKKTVIATTE